MPTLPFRLLCFFFCTFGSLLSGCTTTPTAPAQETRPPHAATAAQDQHAVPVIRAGRYTLIEVGPERSQRDLLQQVIDVTLPASLTPTVGDAVHYVLRYSGYQSCVDHPDADALYGLSLAAVDLQLGPMTLREALQTLAGPAWHLHVDEASREVCFTRDKTAETVPSDAPVVVPAPDPFMPVDMFPFPEEQP